MSAPPRALITRAAADLLGRLQNRHGDLMFHQSGGCCDGSAPMCYPAGEYIVGDRDILLAVLDVGGADERSTGISDERSTGISDERSTGISDERSTGIFGVPVWISGSQFETWKHTQLVIDVVPGRGGGFSLESPEGMRFLSRGRAFTDTENDALAQHPPITGARYADGERPARTGTLIVAEAQDVCPIPAGRAASVQG